MDVSRACGMAAGLAVVLSLASQPHAGGDPPEHPASGPPLRAGGNEPGWGLEIAGRRLVLVSDYGATRREAALDPPVDENGAEVHRSRDGAVTVRLESRLCRDDATGMPHPLTATVYLRERRLKGCGGAPAELLSGVDWRVTEAQGRAVDADAQGAAAFAAPTLRFVFDAMTRPRSTGRATGLAGCNRFSAAVELSGEGLRLGPAVATRMACPEPAMRIEARVFAALEEAARFDFDADGALLLIAADGRMILRARRG